MMGSLCSYSCFLAAALLLIITGCGGKRESDPDISLAAWLIGSWQHAIDDAEIFETWTVHGEKEFHGMGYMIHDQDTVVYESIRLLEEEGQLYYIPTAKGQNDDQPVTFELMSGTENKLVFQNQEHDFPQLITYTKITHDSLVAEISGVLNKEIRVQKYPMRRKK